LILRSGSGHVSYAQHIFGDHDRGRRAFEAMMAMKKIDIATIEAGPLG